jgi:TRAP-type C4-dicarboxylate transport system permease small subunit
MRVFLIKIRIFAVALVPLFFLILSLSVLRTWQKLWSSTNTADKFPTSFMAHLQTLGLHLSILETLERAERMLLRAPFARQFIASPTALDGW